MDEVLTSTQIFVFGEEKYEFVHFPLCVSIFMALDDHFRFIFIRLSSGPVIINDRLTFVGFTAEGGTGEPRVSTEIETSASASREGGYRNVTELRTHLDGQLGQFLAIF